MVYFLAAIVGIIVGLVAIVSGAVKGIQLVSHSVGDRKERRAAELAKEEENAKRLAQQLRVREKNRQTPIRLQTTRSSRAALPFTNPWDGIAGASGFAATYANDLRHRGITPAEHARGKR